MNRPGFVPVHAIKYLPEKVENLTEEEKKEIDGATYFTKMDRGTDLEGMESVVLLKYPFPNLGDPLLRATRKRLGNKKFWMYYHDMAEREFIQQMGRIMRSRDARKEFWSPDAKCYQKLHQPWERKISKGRKSRV